MKKMSKALLFLLSFAIIISQASAKQGNAKNESTVNEIIQQDDLRVIKGTITDALGISLPGVSVFIPGTTLGATTGADGTFALKVPVNFEKLMVSYIGMKDQEIILTGATNYNVTMQPDTIGLGEVVAIGYGSSKKSDISTSISTVSGVEKIKSRSITSEQDFLQGNVPGVTVLQQGGNPTRTARVVIRGVGSINAESPLWVVDGMPFDNPQFINPDDIENISNLKDAAASAIYGAQASSGIIVVKTIAS